MTFIRKQVAAVVLLAALPWATMADADPMDPVIVYPASSCVQQYGAHTEFLQGGLIPRDYDVEGNGLFRGQLNDSTAVGGDDHKLRIYCPIELREDTTQITEVSVATEDNDLIPIASDEDHFVPETMLPPGTLTSFPYISCQVVVATVTGCEGNLTSCEHFTPGAIQVVPTQQNWLFPYDTGDETFGLNAGPIAIAAWPTNGWQYAFLACDLWYGHGIYSYRVRQDHIF